MIGFTLESSHRKKMPVWPVVSMPAKNNAVISGTIWLSDRTFW